MQAPIRKGKYTKLTKARQTRRNVRRHWNWFWRLSRKQKILLITAPILAFLVLTPILTYLAYAKDISDQERLMNRNNTGIVLLDRNGKSFYSIGRAEHRNMVKLSDINKQTAEALIATEDKDFYKHGGFNLLSIGRAIFTNLSSRSMNAYGGSTLTQQLAKNTLLSDEKSFMRKYQELAMSVAIEQNYSKDQILEMYLNSAYFGENAFGIEEAAKVYFNKTPAQLTLSESAMLIGLLPAPSAYSPISGNIEYAKQRQKKVLTRMVAEGYITEAQKNEAYDTPLTYAEGASAKSSDIAPHFAEMVINELSEKYGYEKTMRSGFQVKTTLDTDLQSTLKTNIDGHMKFITANGGSNAAGVAIDPKTGEIRALVGSADWNNKDWGKVNIVTSARQPGSSFKPIYYAAALADGTITPATVLHDKETNFGGNYIPQNADRRFRGDVSVRSAISQSLNIPSIEVMQKYGITKSINFAKGLGINTIDTSKNYGLSLALGSAEARPLDMTNAYAAFANGGKQYNTSTIMQINDKFDKSIFMTTETLRQPINPEGAFLISSILSDNTARAPIFGNSLTVSGHTAAVKTGTTNDSRDAWTIGYTPSLALGVWVGNNDNAAMLNGGSGMAGPIWRETLNDYLKGKPNEQFAVPSGIVQRYACKESGGLASGSGYGTYQEYFKAGALPAPCQPKEEPKVTVCELDTKQIVSVTESQYNDNQSKYSKEESDCQKKRVQVCDTTTGKTLTVDEDEADNDTYSTDIANCKKDPASTGSTNSNTQKMLAVCNIGTKKIEQVPETYDTTIYTTKYTTSDNKNCQPTTSSP